LLLTPEGNRSRLVIAATLLALLAAWGPAWAQAAEDSAGEDPQAPSANTAAAVPESPDLLLLQTGEVMGYLIPCG
jgi:hypothetical protein